MGIWCKDLGGLDMSDVVISLRTLSVQLNLFTFCHILSYQSCQIVAVITTLYFMMMIIMIMMLYAC